MTGIEKKGVGKRFTGGTSGQNVSPWGKTKRKVKEEKLTKNTTMGLRPWESGTNYCR